MPIELEDLMGRVPIVVTEKVSLLTHERDDIVIVSSLL